MKWTDPPPSSPVGGGWESLPASPPVRWPIVDQAGSSYGGKAFSTVNLTASAGSRCLTPRHPLGLLLNRKKDTPSRVSSGRRLLPLPLSLIEAAEVVSSLRRLRCRHGEDGGGGGVSRSAYAGRWSLPFPVSPRNTGGGGGGLDLGCGREESQRGDGRRNGAGAEAEREGSGGGGGGGGGLPTTTTTTTTTTTAASGGGARSRIPKGRQIQKTFNNIKITILCGFVTILVLRGTIGVGDLGGGGGDGEETKVMEDVDRILREIRSDSDPDDEEEQQRQQQQQQQEHDLAAAVAAPTEPPGWGNATYTVVKVDLNNLTFTLGPKISDWDAQRRRWLAENPGFPSEVTAGLGGARSKARILLAIKNKIDYCRLHGIEIIYNMAHLDKELAGYWAKLPLLRRLMLSHPEVEWIWWMDSDALFTDMTFEIPLHRYADRNLVIHGYPDLVFEQHSWISLNTGSFLLRNCQWSLDLLDAWAPMGPKGPVREEVGRLLTAKLKGRPAFEADDQSALIYLLLSKQEQWFPKTFIENSYYLHGYWPGLVDRYEEMMDKYHPGLGDDRWPFVTHFVGCKPCGSYGTTEPSTLRTTRCSTCTASLTGLVDPKIRRFRNETASPLEVLAQEEARQMAFLQQQQQ
ncbi:unnamed protein product [Spirodela intermedia]|uniref:Uncharacterized protein n=1 Tax=Spirodela intermedia TaxID=51605 RepID=A0A7I8JLE0_SPIIN|nr:unnamed protein product [Spirodela intermedia]CAA6670393.1 unnamed protein product [Spirodela intermedia]